ncbi:MAG: VWA domain-containing protein [candidate division Zixibacteria bacterium]|nr:VWA domain-containing protein [candidate division Zixibacteria bacterium]
MKSNKSILLFLCGIVTLLLAPTLFAASGHYYAQVFDLSGSISDTELGNAKPPARLYVRLTPGSTGKIKSFTNNASVPTDLTAWTTNQSTLQSAINNLSTSSGTTALFDALVEAADDLGAQGSATSRELICFTDLGENDSDADTLDVLNAMINNVVVPHIIRYQENPIGVDGADANVIAAQLESIVQARGGKIYVVSSQREIEDAIKDIANNPQLPAITPVGMIILVGLLILTALYWIYRKKQPVTA